MSYEPTFTGFRRFGGQDRAFDRLEQREFVLVASKARSRPPIDGTKALVQS